VTSYHRAGVVPTAQRCFELIEFIEREYTCRLAWWLTIRSDGEKNVKLTIFCSGSGNVFDAIPDAFGCTRAPVLQAQNGNIYPALWACLTQLESNFLEEVGTRYRRPPL